MILSIPRWPSYKLHGSGNSPVLEPCPTNLHTTIMDVITGASPSPPSTPTTPNATDEDVPEASTQITSYVISSMAIPSLNGHNITVNVSACITIHVNIITRIVIKPVKWPSCEVGNTYTQD